MAMRSESPPSCTPTVSLVHVSFTDDLLRHVPRQIAESHCLVPIYLRGQPRTLYVATSNPRDAAALRACSSAAGLPVRAMKADREAIEEAIRVHYAGGAPRAPVVEKRAEGRATPPLVEMEVELDPDSEPVQDLAPPAPPVVLVVSARDDFTLHCHMAAISLGGRLEECDVRSAPTVAAKLRPSVVIVPEEVYAFDRRRFNLLAFESEASLIVWSADADVDELTSLLAAARDAFRERRRS